MLSLVFGYSTWTDNHSFCVAPNDSLSKTDLSIHCRPWSLQALLSTWQSCTGFLQGGQWHGLWAVGGGQLGLLTSSKGADTQCLPLSLCRWDNSLGQQRLVGQGLTGTAGTPAGHVGRRASTAALQSHAAQPLGCARALHLVQPQQSPQNQGMHGLAVRRVAAEGRHACSCSSGELFCFR